LQHARRPLPAGCLCVCVFSRSEFQTTVRFSALKSGQLPGCTGQAGGRTPADAMATACLSSLPKSLVRYACRYARAVIQCADKRRFIVLSLSLFARAYLFWAHRLQQLENF
jgi:hypothetical protein